MKNSSSKLLLIFLCLFVFFIFIVIGFYNNIVTLSENVKTQWAQVETQYQRRYDLIPNLVGAVKGVLVQEQKVFGDIAKARQGYAGATTQDTRVKAAGELDSALARLLVIMENYPVLRSYENVIALQDEIAGTENRIAVERGRYNEAVRIYNVAVKSFPSVVFARFLGFNEKSFYESISSSDTAPKVDLSK